MLFEIPIILLVSFFIVAVIYSSSGFGGGSSYLAILALFSIAFLDIRMIALICNVVVVSGSSIVFYKSGQLKLNKSIGLIILSIPMAFLGASLGISESIFFILLGCTLLFTALLMFSSIDIFPQIKTGFISHLFIGGAIGFLSGLVGIGGGIFLAPILYLGKWDNGKVIAATCALFILVNSIAGISGQIYGNGLPENLTLIFPLGITVLLGGIIGSKISIKFLSAEKIKYITALLIMIVAIRLLIKYL